MESLVILVVPQFTVIGQFFYVYVLSLQFIIIIIIIIRLYNTVGEENRVVREVNRDRLC